MNVKFYLLSSSRSPIELFLLSCSAELKSDFFDAITLLANGHKLFMPHNRNLSNIHPGLNELRLKDRTGQFRFFYFIKKGDSVYVLHAFKKKTQELPLNEIKLVLKRIKEIK